jgi:hypothetical protein
MAESGERRPLGALQRREIPVSTRALSDSSVTRISQRGHTIVEYVRQVFSTCHLVLLLVSAFVPPILLAV